jgi:protein TonB
MSKSRWMGNVRRTDPELRQPPPVEGQKVYERPNTPRHVPTGSLPRHDRRLGAGAGASAILHAAAIVLIVVGGQTLAFLGEGDGPGAVGGGGGGGDKTVHFINLPPAPPRPGPVALQAPEPDEELVELVLPKPDLNLIPPEVAEIAPPTTVQRVVVTRPQDVGTGTGEGAGTGTGSGGGVGSGQGTGMGSNIGPGSGGGGAAYAPKERSTPLLFEAPASMKGREYTIRFIVNRRGRVTRVTVEPEIEDSDFRKKLLDTMYEWTFYPARTAEGRPVQGEYSITYRF